MTGTVVACARYASSGNVFVVDGDWDRSKLRQRAQRGIREDLGLDVVVLLRDTRPMQALVDALPLTSRNGVQV